MIASIIKIYVCSTSVYHVVCSRIGKNSSLCIHREVPLPGSLSVLGNRSLDMNNILEAV